MLKETMETFPSTIVSKRPNKNKTSTNKPKQGSKKVYNKFKSLNKKIEDIRTRQGKKKLQWSLTRYN